MKKCGKSRPILAVKLCISPISRSFRQNANLSRSCLKWDFLNFLAAHAKKYPQFQLRLETEVTDLLLENERVVGVKATTPNGPVNIRANLVMAADGRNSTARARAGLEVVEIGVPIDVLWFRLSKKTNDPPQAFGYVGAQQFMVLINRDKYWQCAYVIRKDSFEEKDARMVCKRFAMISGSARHSWRTRSGEIKEWDDVKLLSVKVDHLRKWHRDGLLCIGDSAHAMSPIGGVGINLAIQNAVATANILGEKLRAGQINTKDLRFVQRRREKPAKLTQKIQIFLHKHLLERIFNSTEIISTSVAHAAF